MKLVPALLLNIVTVAVALLLYDQFRDDAASSATSRANSDRSEVGELVEIRERLREIDAKLAAVPAQEERDEVAERLPREAREPEVETLPAASSREPANMTRDVDAPPADVPTKAEVARFRKLQEAVRRENSVKANWDRINRQLDKVGVNLTPAQREKVHYAWADFEPRINRIWGEIKTEARTTIESGGAIDGKGLREQGSARIQSEFAASLGEIVNHPADAEAIAAALTARGGK